MSRRKNPKGQKVVVLINPTSWDLIGKLDHQVFLYCSRVTFKTMIRKKDSAVGENEKGA